MIQRAHFLMLNKRLYKNIEKFLNIKNYIKKNFLIRKIKFL